MAFSRWSDNTTTNIDGLINNMLNYNDWHTPELDPINNESELLYKVEKVFDNNKTMELNGTDIQYNLIKYEYERVNSGEETNEMRSSRIINMQFKIIIYSDGLNTQYIIDRSNSNATKTILRKLNNYNSQGEIKSNEFKITDDLFVWMISKVLNSSDESIDQNKSLLITKIVGFKGSSDDKLAEVTGSGNRIMNALSTLAFLFENEGVSYVKPVVEYDNHTIELFLKMNGSIDINFDNYVGKFIAESENNLLTTLTLMVSLEVIPKIISKYGEECESETWSKNEKSDMITGIGKSILDKITEKVNSFQK